MRSFYQENVKYPEKSVPAIKVLCLTVFCTWLVAERVMSQHTWILLDDTKNVILLRLPIMNFFCNICFQLIKPAHR